MASCRGVATKAGECIFPLIEVQTVSSTPSLEKTVQCRIPPLGLSAEKACREMAYCLLPVAAALLVVVMSGFAPSTLASDADPLQDFCVADNPKSPSVHINGYTCKSVDDTVADDFKYTGLKKAKDASGYPVGSIVTTGFVKDFPGVNTLGISLHRVDLAKGGLNPPHHHARATEIIFLLTGTLEVGFVPSQSLKVYKTTLEQGEVFVFPRGSLIFMLNIGDGPASILSALNTQNSPGAAFASQLFGSGLPKNLLAKNLGISEKQVEYIEKHHAADAH